MARLSEMSIPRRRRRLLHEAGDVALAAHLDPESARAVGQHGFDGLLIHRAGRRSGSFCASFRIRDRPAKWPLNFDPRHAVRSAP
jgi:hypothetical protein